jgi:hypothetical protein
MTHEWQSTEHALTRCPEATGVALEEPLPALGTSDVVGRASPSTTHRTLERKSSTASLDAIGKRLREIGFEDVDCYWRCSSGGGQADTLTAS